MYRSSRLQAGARFTGTAATAAFKNILKTRLVKKFAGYVNGQRGSGNDVLGAYQ
jgi:hypothetical protein